MPRNGLNQVTGFVAALFLAPVSIEIGLSRQLSYTHGMSGKKSVEK
jgi:hypothetical protein